MTTDSVAAIITEILHQEWFDWSGPCDGCSCELTAEIISERLAGELAATKMLLDATRKELSDYIRFFVAMRDALPKERVREILGDDR